MFDMSLYFTLAVTAVVGIMLRFRYGPVVIPYAAAALMLVLFLHCPTRFYDGIGSWLDPDRFSVDSRIDRLSEIVSFSLLFLSAWVFGSAKRRRSGDQR
jgi:hypothetical protein